ncbi:glycosyltransferase [Puia sp. P3]|uniref:glycosyltransferase n=1 Tax=Puia sp. P3 TaxID=3423952 RepID=UPI003D6757DB
MILSVIIVNYRVQYFLELCLRSVQKSTQDVESEIIVIDNNSEDDSLAYLRPLFPSVKFIANTENTGFARANNLALKQARGKYILFLNPDTIVPENFVKEVLEFYASAAMETYKSAVKGTGNPADPGLAVHIPSGPSGSA